MNIPIYLKKTKQKESTLFTQFVRNKVFLKFYSGKKVKNVNWSKAKEIVLPKEENHDLINLYLDNWKRELRRIIEGMEANKIPLDRNTIQEELDKAMNKDKLPEPGLGVPTDFISYMDMYISSKKANRKHVQKLQQTKKLVIVGFNLITKKNLDAYNKLTIRQKTAIDLKADRQLSFKDINLFFVKRFREMLLSTTYTVKINKVEVTRNYKVNYVDKQVKGLKQFISAAIEDKFVEHFTWNSIKAENREVDSIYTDFKEIQAIYDTELTDPTEAIVRDKYVLNCFLGMRYSDINQLEPHLFRHSTIGEKEFLVYEGRNKKTDTKVEFALPPIAEIILKKYNYNIPKLNATEYNIVIKQVALKAGLTNLIRIREIRGYETINRDIPKWELMSSHTGRRSFFTNYYNEGVTIAAIMSISGHKTEKDFRKYIKKASVRLDIVAEQVLGIKSINHLRVA